MKYTTTRALKPVLEPPIQARPAGADAGEEGFGGLVGRIRRDELAAEGALKDGAAEGGRAATGSLDRGAEPVARRQR